MHSREEVVLVSISRPEASRRAGFMPLNARDVCRAHRCSIHIHKARTVSNQHASPRRIWLLLRLEDFVYDVLLIIHRCRPSCCVSDDGGTWGANERRMRRRETSLHPLRTSNCQIHIKL